MDSTVFTNESWPNASLPSSSTSPFTGLDLLFHLKPLFIPLYALLVLVACTGNLLLILLIVLTKKLHSTTNFLIGNLAAADLVMCLFCVPLTATYAFEPRGWLFGSFTCHFVALMQAATVLVAVLSLTAIAVDRYVVVAYPIRRRAGRRRCFYLVGAIWLASLALSTPTSLHTTHLDLRAAGHDMTICEEFWQDQERERLIYSCSLLLLSYLVPLSAISVSYCAITHHLRKRSVPGAAPSSNRERWARKKHKTFRLLLVSVLSFALCWLPLQVVNLIMDLDLDFAILDKSYVNVVQVSCHLVAMSSACYNPFIYASLHEKFRFHLGRYFSRGHQGSTQSRGARSSSTLTHTHTHTHTLTSHRIPQIHTCFTMADIPTDITDKLVLEGRFSFH
ncbi:prolactin-releasing peptide receptor-like [Acipenser oxyrinchus oxyrinchus]|uniref:Prolactin-releasing peptide receptor-like n=1 Tax=Acipenser oxyrinchus oxyrinchus TaxID=40147 RepID=A0AAD8FX92_ACIOX|nr:prolactin-releasing peptide receptor-like [Acipenser oxyrinchus oxyrinchus]